MLRFGAHRSILCDAIAALAHRFLNSIVPWDDISTLVANRLIALDKYPGVCPIGIGEALWCVICKAVCYATRVDVELACGSDQLCGSVRPDIEGSIHSLLLQRVATTCWGALLMDASNAFNNFNHVECTCTLASLYYICLQYLSWLGNTGYQKL